MKKHNLAFTDIETTGLNVFLHEIIQIGCVITDPNLNVIEEFELKINPENIENADMLSLKINHYKEKDWKDAMSIHEAIKIFSRKTKECILVGHNIPFDSSFLDKAFFDTKIEKKFFHYYTIDTVSIAFSKLKNNEDISKFTLHKLCEYFDIKNEKEHTALSDARATYMLYKKLMSM